MKKICIMFTSLFAFAIAIVAQAQGAEQLVDVVATGYGSTPREATKAALRSAVEAVVGTIVDATTLVENDKLIEDEILSYSAGMIASAKPIGEPKKSTDGLYTVKIKASVKKGRLEEKLKAASAVNLALDGADLFARMTAAKDNQSDADAMIKSVLAKHIGCVIAEPIPGKNGKSPIDLDPKTGELFANIRVRIDQRKYMQFANEIVEKIGPMAEGNIKLRSSKYHQGNGEFDYDYKYRDYQFIVMTNPRSRSAIAYKFEKNILDAILSSFSKGSLGLSVTLVDKQGTTMAEEYQSFRELYNYNYLTLFACNNEDFACIMPFYYAELNIVNGNCVQCVGEKCRGRAEGKFRISLGKFSPEELKSAGELKIKVGHMKRDQFFE